MLQSYNAGQLKDLEKALYSHNALRIELQWIPSHCGIRGNEQADKMAKMGAREQQENNPVSLMEMKTIIKSLFRSPPKPDPYHQLSRQAQVVIFRLRTGHNRLNKHLHRKLKIAPSPMYPCGEEEQDTAHILQDCRTLQMLRVSVA